MHNYAPPATYYSGYLHEVPSGPEESQEYSRNTGDYDFLHFTEESNPELALAAQQLQGESYLAAGYISERDLDEYGRLSPDLDKARGDNVEYVVARKDDKVVGAVRLVAVPEGGSLRDLPAFEKSHHEMYSDYRLLLEQAHAEDGSRGVIEVAGLSRSKEAPPSVLLEVIRDIVQRAMLQKSEEVWLVTATDNSFDMIQSRFGKSAITSIGPRVPVLDDGEDTREYLQPSVIVPGILIEGMVNSIKIESNIAQRRRLMKTLGFMMDGLSVEAGEAPLCAVELLEESGRE